MHDKPCYEFTEPVAPEQPHRGSIFNAINHMLAELSNAGLRIEHIQRNTAFVDWGHKQTVQDLILAIGNLEAELRKVRYELTNTL